MSKALEILQELKEVKRYSFMHERIDEAIEELLAQPKREPIDSNQVIVPDWMISKDERQAFVIGFRDAEKSHGIGVE